MPQLQQVGVRLSLSAGARASRGLRQQGASGALAVGALPRAARGGVGVGKAGRRLAVSGAQVGRAVSGKAIARRAGGRLAPGKCAKAPAAERIKGAAVEAIRRAASVRQRAAGRRLEVSNAPAGARVQRLLEGWQELPAAWAAVQIGSGGFVGRSLAALAYLRGAAVSWDSASRAVSVGGQVVIGDNGRTVTAASLAGAVLVVDRQCEALAAIVGAAACLRGELRQVRADTARRAARVAVGKASRALAAGGIEAARAAALRDELAWREVRF
jgi:hypothetical protein